MSPLLLALPLLVFAASANAQVYKCEGPNGVTYSDAPCKSGKQTVTEIPANLTGTAPVDGQSGTPSLKQQMDQAVKAAIAANDMQRARALASGREHHEWIAAATRSTSPPVILGRTEADLSAEQGGTIACEQARRSYELEASSSFVEVETLQAKRSIMNAACGIKEPITADYGISSRTYYPAPYLQPYYNSGFQHRYRPYWGFKPHPRPATEPPAVSINVGPKK